MLGINAPLRLTDGVEHRADVNPEVPADSVRMRTLGFRITAGLPSGGGDGG
ncbi:hypothetical protein ACWCYL_10770 [Streptomyces sp. 900105755]